MKDKRVLQCIISRTKEDVSGEESRVRIPHGTATVIWAPAHSARTLAEKRVCVSSELLQSQTRVLPTGCLGLFSRAETGRDAMVAVSMLSSFSMGYTTKGAGQ